MYARWTKVIITTNIHPDEWYSRYFHADPAHKAALDRRIPAANRREVKKNVPVDIRISVD